MEIIQVLALIFVLFALSRAFLRHRDNEISVFELILWSVIWAGVLIIAFIPDVTFILSRIAGIQRGIDAIIYISIVFLFYMLFRAYVRMEKIEQNITEMVRQVALMDNNRSRKRKR